MRQQFSLKPLKRKIQLATGGKRRKIKGSQSHLSRYSKNPSYDKARDFKKSNSSDSTRKDTSNFIEPTGKGFALMDTVIRIYYEGLTDSVLNNYKKRRYKCLKMYIYLYLIIQFIFISEYELYY